MAYPFGAALVAMVAIVVERIMALVEAARGQTIASRAATLLATTLDPVVVLSECEATPGALARVVAAGVSQAGRGELQVREAIEQSRAEESARLRQRLGAV